MKEPKWYDERKPLLPWVVLEDGRWVLPDCDLAKEMRAEMRRRLGVSEPQREEGEGCDWRNTDRRHSPRSREEEG